MNKATSLQDAVGQAEGERANDSAVENSAHDGGSRERADGAGRSSPIESGIFSGVMPPVVAEQLLESLQSALGAASRGDAGLGSLQRSLQDSTRALSASQQAQQQLTDELRVLYRGLNEVISEKAALERYAALLTQERDAALDAAEDTRREAKRDRDFLIREQDRFIQLLIEEHEAEVASVRRESERTDPAATLDPLSSESGPVSSAPVAEIRSIGEPSSPDGAGLEEAPTQPGSDPNNPRVRLVRVPMPQRYRGGRESERPAASSSTLRAKTQRSDAPPLLDEEDRGSYPPPPAVLDLEALAEEVDGNSERPPPIQSIKPLQSELRLPRQPVPSRLMDTLVSAKGDEPSESADDEKSEREGD